jgi:hypothetical protein
VDDYFMKAAQAGKRVQASDLTALGAARELRLRVSDLKKAISNGIVPAGTPAEAEFALMRFSQQWLLSARVALADRGLLEAASSRFRTEPKVIPLVPGIEEVPKKPEPLPGLPPTKQEPTRADEFEVRDA